MKPEPCLLIGDLGGSNARFALALGDAGGYGAELTLPCRDFETAEEALESYLERVEAPRPAAICLAAAGPVVDGRVQFLNNSWRLDTGVLKRRFGTDRVRLINDFEAVAWSIPLLRRRDLDAIGPPAAKLNGGGDFCVGALGPGTGLGMAGLARRDGRYCPVVSEGGHAGFAPETELQVGVLRQLRKRHERVSDERLLSGPGLETIYRALCGMNGQPEDARATAPEILQRTLDGSDALASATVSLFHEVLGQVAGNLALTLGAWDGIYIAGGIVKRHAGLLAVSRFRAGFENKGRYRPLMQRIPTLLITHDQPGLLGAAQCMREMLRR